MTLAEFCQASQEKLDAVSRAMLDPRPEILEHCEAELQDVIAWLESAKPSDAVSGTANRGELMRLRPKIRVLASQTQSAVNLCQGWIQLSLSQGYTDQGTPVLPAGEPQASYEV